MMQIFEYTVNYFKTGNFYDEDCSQKMPKTTAKKSNMLQHTYIES
jgi:hypothetical protein